MGKIFELIQQSHFEKRSLFAVLVDPDKQDSEETATLASNAETNGADIIYVGSSLLTNGTVSECVKTIKMNCSLPVVLFPGSTMQVTDKANALLLLSLISGRNPDLLIGNHVSASSNLIKSKLEIIPTGYMLIDPGHPTSASYMSNTQPIPHDKNDIALNTALAGQLLGMRLIFMDAGSGAKKQVSNSMIKTVSQALTIPLIVGGGITTPEKAQQVCAAGATVVVVGNAIEKEQSLIKEIAEAIKNQVSI